ncbi:hypothetical protein CUMW_172260 [Citrus unshiu]|uniref:Uncharacterized protein n=1 Tax=Citrus unshiu TaxID=55188 RepID=A0A2H5PVV4_CITUN|nr:hypothetical protein CUMW_172260 [Citrus unshiu]GAY56485.1 hypothetical protein CUMW_172260 [Citrus unshiu]GAY56486.1 hypothetical protein CUMW_172260 [Citrus unshiu]
MLSLQVVGHLLGVPIIILVTFNTVLGG